MNILLLRLILTKLIVLPILSEKVLQKFYIRQFKFKKTLKIIFKK